jgi:hypothetical protein
LAHILASLQEALKGRFPQVPMFRHRASQYAQHQFNLGVLHGRGRRLYALEELLKISAAIVIVPIMERVQRFFSQIADGL